MRVKHIVLLLPFLWFSASAQEVLSVQEFLDQLAKNHPVMAQADARVGQSEADIRYAKGAFDPNFTFDNQVKTLDGKNYFRYETPELSWQSPFGLKLKAGQEYSAGSYINPEKTKGQLQYLGMELPLLQGLLTDYKRTALKQAKIYKQQSETDRQSILNDLMFSGLQAYNNWALTHKLLNILETYRANSYERQRLVKMGFENGYYAAADTIEALSQRQNIDLLYSQTNLDFQKASFALAQFLWDEEQTPYIPDENLLPENLQTATVLPEYEIYELIELAKNNHPDIRAYTLKTAYYEAYRKLQFQKILPTANLKFNYLSPNYAGFVATNPGLQNNYKLGFTVRIPLLFREGRGALEKAQLKLTETDWATKQKIWEVETKVRNYHNAYEQLKGQSRMAQDMQENYRALLNNEVFKFKQGESSLFYVNTRENKWLDSQQKLLQTQLKLFNALYQQEWAAGILLNRVTLNQTP
ncbi:TolC family protein [Marinilongibacter aquaticus]|uniref:TolC family protein n=1 Tax=Marinilongibacter aquaticus TaxID=2975157 RepID=UPI0021BDB9D9|nr:TolC family protein [Marinilongibacter aquaticus]UBM58920.1 TolC family protein [Marinilongibacter aquaticus]